MHNGNGTSGHPGASHAVDSDLAVRLMALGRRVSPVEISELWVFPPLPDIEDSGDFVLFTRVLTDEMRRVCAVEFTEPDPSAPVRHLNGNGNGNGNGDGVAETGAPDRDEAENGVEASRPDASNGATVGPGGAPTVRITEYGRVPSNRVQRVVDGFRRRLGDEREPIHLRVDGCADSWGRMLASDSSDG